MRKPGRIAYMVLVVFFSSLVLLIGAVAIVLVYSLLPDGIGLENAMNRPLFDWVLIGLIGFFAVAFLVQGLRILIRGLSRRENFESERAEGRAGEIDSPP